MDIQEMKNKLRQYEEENLILSDHVILRCQQRGISIENLKEQILNPENLIGLIEQESRYLQEKKFKLVFDISKNKSFVIVITINKSINIVTALIRYRKWMKPMEFRKRR